MRDHDRAAIRSAPFSFVFQHRPSTRQEATPRLVQYSASAIGRPMQKRVDVITSCRLCELLAKDLTSANLRIIDFSPTLRGGVRMAGHWQHVNS